MTNNRLHIYTPQLTPRVQYVFDAVFGQMLSLDVVYETDLSVFENITEAKIYYGNTKPNNASLWIKSHSLLFENDIQPQPYQIVHWNGIKSIALGAHDALESFCPFDPMATIFFLLSRYEEYICKEKDAHGRFSAHSSILYKEDLLLQPLVNQLVAAIYKVIHSTYPHIVHKQANFKIIPTFDIDMAFAYQEKGWKRGLGGFAKDVFKFEWQRIKDRFFSVLRLQKDPYDVFDYLEKKIENHDARFFFLMADHAPFDSNIDVKNKRFQAIIKKISEKNKVGIHPSYQSNSSISILEKEKNRLQYIVNEQVIRSRQHFLKLDLPSTYRNLIAQGIKEDWTLGFAEAIGWRAAMASPFYWFDLERNEQTPLLLYPTAAMDVTLKQYLKLNPNEAIALLSTLINNCKATNGQFIFIWHNSSFYTQEGWQDWNLVFEFLMSHKFIAST